MELEDEGDISRTAATGRRRQRGAAPTPRDEAVARLLGPLITPIANPQLSAACLADSVQYLTSIFSQLWALRMFDATGKLPDGVLLGNVYPWGNWDEPFKDLSWRGISDSGVELDPSPFAALSFVETKNLKFDPVVFKETFSKQSRAVPVEA